MFRIDIRPAGNFVPFEKIRDIGKKRFSTREEAMEYMMWRLCHIDRTIEVDLVWDEEVDLSAEGKYGRFTTVGFYIIKVE